MIYIIIPFRSSNGHRARESQWNFLRLAFMRISHTHLRVIRAVQDDGAPFNRGAILNRAFQYLNPFPEDIIIFHDVDLLPSKDLLTDYYFLPIENNQVMHIGSLFFRYSAVSKSFLGGVLKMTAYTFRNIGGYPSDFFSWGGEDDELRDRILHKQITIKRPENTSKYTLKDMENNGNGYTLKEKLCVLKFRNEKCMNKRELRKKHSSERDAPRGLQESLRFPIQSKQCLSSYEMDIVIHVYDDSNSNMR